MQDVQRGQNLDLREKTSGDPTFLRVSSEGQRKNSRERDAGGVCVTQERGARKGSVDQRIRVERANAQAATAEQTFGGRRFPRAKSGLVGRGREENRLAVRARTH